MKVADRERIAVLRVSHPELPLVVGAPELIGGPGVLVSKRRRGMIAPTFGSLLDQAVPIQQIMNRAPNRQVDVRIPALEHLLEFGGSPCRLLPLQFQNRCLNSWRDLTC